MYAFVYGRSPVRITESNLLFNWEFRRTGSDSAEIQFLGEGGKTFPGDFFIPRDPLNNSRLRAPALFAKRRRRVETAAREVGEKI